jgi:hypothetical protein
MKTNCIRLNRLAPWAGVALIAGGVVTAVTHVNVERKIRSSEAVVATLDRLFQEHQITVALKRIHDGEVTQAAQHLDLLLCSKILMSNAELASADPQTRAFIERSFKRIALLRPKAEVTAAGAGREPADDQVAAERILSLAQSTPGGAERK